jgi:hypothetical protein
VNTAPLFRAAGLLHPADALRAALGLFVEPAEIPDEVQAILVQTAEHFLRGGGRVTLREWRRMTAVERGSLSAAGLRLAAEAASSTGFASTSPAAALAVHGILDGGRTAATVANHAALEAAASRIASERGGTPLR